MSSYYGTSTYLNGAVVAKDKISHCLNHLATKPPRVGPAAQSLIGIEHLGNRRKNLFRTQRRVPEAHLVIMLRCVEHDDRMGQNGLIGWYLNGGCRPAYQLLKDLFDNPAQIGL